MITVERRKELGERLDGMHRRILGVIPVIHENIRDYRVSFVDTKAKDGWYPTDLE